MTEHNHNHAAVQRYRICYRLPDGTKGADAWQEFDGDTNLVIRLVQTFNQQMGAHTHWYEIDDGRQVKSIVDDVLRQSMRRTFDV